MNTKPLYNTELSNPPAALIRLTDIWENDMVPNQSPGRKRSPGRNAKVRQCIDIPLAMELRGASQYATKVVRVCTVLDNMTNRAQNQV